MLFSFFFRAKTFLSYWYKSGNAHGLHSPFVFQLYTQVIQSKNGSSDFEIIESYRKELLKSPESIDITDFGAGSGFHKSNTRKISDVAKNAQKIPKQSQLLYRLVHHFKPKTVLELGTSFGLTTQYLQVAVPNAHIYTFEGCPETAKIAQKGFGNLPKNHIEIVVGNIDETLIDTLKSIKQLDFAYFDANHRYEPTICYFEACLEKANEESVFVFDDIYWSEGMKDAWEYIKNQKKVSISIDLYTFGIVFFRTKQPKQHFVLRA